MSERRMDHDHQPLFRVVRAGWDDPLDASHSQSTQDRRWNTAAFAALYCCCSERVACAVARDVFRAAGVLLEDVQPGFRPELSELQWQGQVVDLVTADGVRQAGFPPEYPLSVDKQATRRAGERWHAEAAEGVCCRSASLARLGMGDWSGDHRRFGELAIFPTTTAQPPTLLRRRRDSEWLRAAPNEPRP